MALTIRFSPQASRDLRSIFTYIARDSEEHARAQVERIRQATERLSDFPESGREVPELPESDLREVISGNYRVLYRVTPAAIEVITIRHGSRKLPNKF